MEQKRLGAYHLDSGDPETFVVGQLLRKDLAWLLMRDVTPDGSLPLPVLPVQMEQKVLILSIFAKYHLVLMGSFRMLKQSLKNRMLLSSLSAKV